MQNESPYLPGREREAGTLQEIQHTTTVGALIDFLKGYDENLPIVLSFDGGYTYGSIEEFRIQEWDDAED